MIFTLSMLMKSSGSRREHVQMRSFGSEIKNAKIKQLEDTIIEQDNTIAENQKLLAEKDAELLRLQKELAKLKQL